MGDCSGDDHSVQLITVLPQKTRAGQRDLRRKRKGADAFRPQGLLDPGPDVAIKRDAASSLGFSDFVAANGRDADLLGVQDRSSGSIGEVFRPFRPPPEPNVSVEDDHSRFTSHSLGSMILMMSPRTVTLPSRDLGGLVGPSFATGFPRLVTMISLPVSAASSSSARQCALNSPAGTSCFS